MFEKKSSKYSRPNHIHPAMMESLEHRQLLSGIPFPAGVGAVDTNIGAVADFNGDGQPDLLMRNYDTGANKIILVNVAGDGSTSFQFCNVTAIPPAAGKWVIEGAADFNHDGITDILWRNYNTGKNVIWYMNSRATPNGSITYSSGGYLPDVPTGPDWRIEGVADFDGDGNPDLVWRSYQTGADALWLMNSGGLTIKGSPQVLGPTVPTNWALEAVGDLNNNGHPALVWRNYSTGQATSGAIIAWLMGGTNNMTTESTVLFATNTNLNWDVEGMGDFNNDHETDIVLRLYDPGNPTTAGEDWAWTMNGTTLVTGHAIGAPIESV